MATVKTSAVNKTKSDKIILNQHACFKEIYSKQVWHCAITHRQHLCTTTKHAVANCSCKSTIL